MRSTVMNDPTLNDFVVMTTKSGRRTVHRKSGCPRVRRVVGKTLREALGTVHGLTTNLTTHLCGTCVDEVARAVLYDKWGTLRCAYEIRSQLEIEQAKAKYTAATLQARRAIKHINRILSPKKMEAVEILYCTTPQSDGVTFRIHLRIIGHPSSVLDMRLTTNAGSNLLAVTRCSIPLSSIQTMKDYYNVILLLDGMWC